MKAAIESLYIHNIHSSKSNFYWNYDILLPLTFFSFSDSNVVYCIFIHPSLYRLQVAHSVLFLFTHFLFFLSNFSRIYISGDSSNLMRAVINGLFNSDRSKTSSLYQRSISWKTICSHFFSNFCSKSVLLTHSFPTEVIFYISFFYLSTYIFVNPRASIHFSSLKIVWTLTQYFELLILV